MAETNRFDGLVERAIHDAFRQLAQVAWDEYGVCVRAVQFDWNNHSTVVHNDLKVSEVEIQTMTKV